MFVTNTTTKLFAKPLPLVTARIIKSYAHWLTAKQKLLMSEREKAFCAFIEYKNLDECLCY